MAFQGYYIKVGNYAIPLTFMKVETYKISPCQIQDLDAYRDANGLLHRNALAHTATKAEFQTPYLGNYDFRQLIDNIRANLLTFAEYDCNLSYYDVESDSYKEGHFYMPATREYLIFNKEIYAPNRIAFIEY